MSTETTEDHVILGKLFCTETLFPHGDWAAGPVMAYKVAASDPDMIYLHQAMQQPGWTKFIVGMQKEMDHQMEGGNFSIMH